MKEVLFAEKNKSRLSHNLVHFGGREPWTSAFTMWMSVKSIQTTLILKINAMEALAMLQIAQKKGISFYI